MNGERSNALPAGTRLQEQYQVEKVLGYGGFGITYLARDTRLDYRIAIKEYLPGDLAVRESDHTVRPRSPTLIDDFKWGLDSFLKEARTLARFKHPNIVRVYNFFEANATAYMVMEYEEGQNLSSYLERHTITDEDQLRKILFPVLDGLEVLHTNNVIHRDVKPSNLFLRSTGTPVLLDFGAARSLQRNRELTVVFTPRYSPPEQFDSLGQQGPWTDIYSLGSVLYEIISGRSPVDTIQRIEAARRNRADPLRPAWEVGKGVFSATLLAGIDWAMQLEEQDRPQSIAEWREQLTGLRLVPFLAKTTSAAVGIPPAHADTAAAMPADKANGDLDGAPERSGAVSWLKRLLGIGTTSERSHGARSGKSGAGGRARIAKKTAGRPQGPGAGAEGGRAAPEPKRPGDLDMEATVLSVADAQAAPLGTRMNALDPAAEAAGGRIQTAPMSPGAGAGAGAANEQTGERKGAPAAQPGASASPAGDTRPSASPAKPQPQLQPQTQSQTQPQTQPQTQLQPRPQKQPQARAQARPTDRQPTGPVAPRPPQVLATAGADPVASTSAEKGREGSAPRPGDAPPLRERSMPPRREPAAAGAPGTGTEKTAPRTTGSEKAAAEAAAPPARGVPAPMPAAASRKEPADKATEPEVPDFIAAVWRPKSTDRGLGSTPENGGGFDFARSKPRSAPANPHRVAGVWGPSTPRQAAESGRHAGGVFDAQRGRRHATGDAFIGSKAFNPRDAKPLGALANQDSAAAEHGGESGSPSLAPAPSLAPSPAQAEAAVLVERGNTLHWRGQEQEALELWERALALVPGDEDLERKIERLRSRLAETAPSLPDRAEAATAADGDKVG